MIAAGRRQILHGKQAAALGHRLRHQLIQRKPVLVLRKLRHTPEIADRLKMHAPHHRRTLHGKADDRSDLIHIDPRHDHRHQRHADPVLSTVLDGPLFYIQHRLTAQRLVNLIRHAVKLHEHEGEPGVRQLPHKRLILSQPHAIAV